ncbi:MAG: NAD(P)H-dependent oxidoreductase [Muribaculaceae bacterium]|nr:NAD(P)H-dependent oxidoreductase [Muribaculaceae bacterium]
MKLKTILLAFVGLLMTTSSCAQTQQSKESKSENMDKGKKVLVAYFSATGTTKAVAEDLAKVMDATLFEIEPTEKYTSADLDWRDDNSRSSVEMHDPNSRPGVKDKVEDMAQYDVVFIGYPIWWYIAPTIINTFIDENNLDGKKVYCFATSGGSPIAPCVDALKKQYPNIDWQEGKLLNGATETTLEAWKKEIGL